jgi:UDP-N-acetylmuramoyl-L-alanyl-D-glutamate--2,6-diaminopimelate ligase
MRLEELLRGLDILRAEGDQNRDIRGIAYDSRMVRKDYLFVAVRGLQADGHDYIQNSIDRGATAIIGEKAVEKIRSIGPASARGAACIDVPDSREALARVSVSYYGYPSRRLALVGITGTNGKTTTSFITKRILEAAGRRTGLLGTICYMTGSRTSDAVNTTPESLDLQMYLSEMVESGMKAAVIEVSSHALALKRVAGCEFSVAAFTNFSQDHLDFHITMDEYFEMKSRIFGLLAEGGKAVLNHDDPRIRMLEGSLKCPVVTFGLGRGAMIRAANISSIGTDGTSSSAGIPAGMRFDVTTPEERFSVSTPLIGKFNVYNILTAVAVAWALGIGTSAVQEGIAMAGSVAGRFEAVDEGQDFLCIVDYAHTDDALDKLITAAKPLTRKRIITVFGCGGDRDRTKRPRMGRVASELSDFVIITSDNPRFEAPERIIRDILEGVKRKNFTVRPNREEAIRHAVAMASAGDTVLVAGKGHETYQEVRGVRHHFDDREVLRDALRSRRKQR